MDPDKILLVDDEEGIRKVLGISLADGGYRVFSAEDGTRALEIFRHERPAIVLTDIKMPGMDGIELLRRIKEERPETEVIMISGHGDMDLAIRSLAHEATHFITKPINDEELETALRRAHTRIEARKKQKEYERDMEALLAELSGKGASKGEEHGDLPLSAHERRELARIGTRLKVSLLALDRILAQGAVQDLERLRGMLAEISERINAVAKGDASDPRRRQMR